MPLRVSCPGPVLRLVCLGGGGAARSRFPPTWLGAVCPLWGGSARLGRSSAGGGGAAACAPFSPTVRPGGPVGRGVALPQPVPLPSLGWQQSGCPRRPSGHGGRGPHTAPVRVCSLSLGTVRVAPLCASAASLAHRGSCESVRLGRGGWPCSSLPPGRRGPAGGRRDHLPASGGGGPAPPWLAGRWGGGGTGGGARRGSPPPPSGGGGLRLSALSPFRRRRIPPRRTRSVRVVGQPLAPGAVRCRQASLAGGGGEGRPVSRPPVGLAGEPGRQGVAPSQPVSLPSLGGPQCGRHRRRSGHGGRGPHTAPVRCRVPRPGVVRALPLCTGVVSARLSRPPREQAAGGAGARGVRVQLRPPPGVVVPTWGRGDTPSAPGGVEGRRPRGPQAGGGVGGERGGGGRAAVPCPPVPGGWAPPLTKLVPPGLPGSRGR